MKLIPPAFAQEHALPLSNQAFASLTLAALGLIDKMRAGILVALVHTVPVATSVAYPLEAPTAEENVSVRKTSMEQTDPVDNGYINFAEWQSFKIKVNQSTEFSAEKWSPPGFILTTSDLPNHRRGK